MIIDIHTHIGKDKNVAVDLRDLEVQMKKNKVNHCACFKLSDDVVKASDELRKACNESCFSFFVFFWLDPNNIDLNKLENKLKSFDGIKLHPRMQNFDPLDKKYDPIFRIIEKSGLVVLIHTRKENLPSTDPDRLIELVERYPKINFIFGHFANGVESVISKAKELKNLYLETSIVSSPMIIKMGVKMCGSEKILFGSDFPYSDQELELEKVLRCDISEKDKNNILFRNAVRLLGENNFIENS